MGDDPTRPASAPPPGAPRAWQAFALPAFALAAIAAMVPTGWWASFFHHPARVPIPDVTQRGALFWRVMLAGTAVALLAFPWVYAKARRGWQVEASRPLASADQPRRRAIMLIGIVAFALALRATRLGESLWYDEIASWLSYGVGVSSPGPIVGNYFDPVNHVFHTLLSWCSVRALEWLVGSELALRLPALTFSILGVLAMFTLGRTAASGRVGIIAAGLAAFMPVCVLEGIEARGYSMMICFAALATVLLWRLRQRPTASIAVAYALCCAIGIWSQFVTAFVPIGHGVWLAWRAMRHGEWPAFRVGLAALAFAALLTVTLYAPMLFDMMQARAMFFSSRGDEPTILGAEGRHALWQLGGSWYWWAAAPGLLLGLIGLFSLRTRPAAARSLVALAIIGLPLMILVVIASGSWIYARFTFFALPAGLLLMALGIDWLWIRRPPLGWIALAALLGASIADLSIRPPKQPLREAAMFVRHHATPGEPVLAIGLAHEVLRAYAGDLNLAYSLFAGRDLERHLQQYRPTWVIVEYPQTVRDETWALLHRAGYVEQRRFDGWVDWTNGDIIVLKNGT